MKYKFSIPLLLIICSTKPVFGQLNIEKNILEILNGKDLKSSSFGLVAIDLDSNQPLLNINGEKSLCPASVLKISTTIAALELLGEDYKFQTIIGYSGKIINSELVGDLIIIGNGDPTFGSEAFNKSPDKILAEICEAIKVKGIKKISGNIISDDSYFDFNPISPKWIYEDYGNYYGAGAYGLNWRDNTYSLFLKSTNDLVSIEKTIPSVEGIVFNNQLKTADNNQDNAVIFGEPFEYNKKINGTIPKQQISFEIKGALPDPALQFSRELQKKLIEESITVSGKPTTVRLIKTNSISYKVPELIKLMEITSPPLKDIIAHTNIESDNIYAESLIKLVGKKTIGYGSFESGLKGIKEFWVERNINIEGMNLEDGSGLSRFNSISSFQIVSMLQFEFKSKNSKSFNNSLPVAGVSGGMKNIGKNTIAESNIYAKTGYMTRVRSYAGYLTSKSKKKIAFSLMVNNYSCTATEAKKKLEQVMLLLLEY